MSRTSQSDSGHTSALTVAAIVFGLGISLAGCKHEAANPSQEGPPAATVIEAGGSGTVTVDKPERFTLATASSQQLVNTLEVTGSVSPDVSREIPVLSLANGRVIALHVGLGDTVHKGELLMDVQSPDITTAFNAYLKAVNDEHLTSVTLDRDKLLYGKGAIPQAQLQAAQNGEDDANADLTATKLQLKIYGVDPNHPGDTVHIYAPASGVIISQNVTAAGAAGITYAGNSGLLTIADLSHVWVICDVYENDLAHVHLGEHADIRLNAFPGKTFSGTISDIGAQLDPSLRTAKVRIQVQNPQGQLRLGMFATASLEASQSTTVPVVPADAVLQLHDRAYVFEPSASSGTFRRVQVTLGRSLQGNNIAIQSGLSAGQQVVANALDLQNTADQQ